MARPGTGGWTGTSQGANTAAVGAVVATGAVGTSEAWSTAGAITVVFVPIRGELVRVHMR